MEVRCHKCNKLLGKIAIEAPETTETPEGFNPFYPSAKVNVEIKCTRCSRIISGTIYGSTNPHGLDVFIQKL